jgi:phytoene desaturase
MLTIDRPKAVVRAPRSRPPAVVIGSGFGGLAAAIRLGARGYRVTIIEKLSGPGGRASVLRKDGFTFDLGPTIVTAPFLFEELWALCGRRMDDHIELRPMTPFYQIRFENGDVFNTTGDDAAMRAEVARFNPADVEGFQRFMRRSEAIYRIGFEQLGDVPFSSILDMARIAGDLLRLGGHRSVYDLVSKYIRDERLRTVFSFHPLLIGGNPFRASAIYCLIPFLEKRWGVHFAMGGTGALVQGLVDLIESPGGELRCGEEVESILVEDGAATGVALASGETIAARIVVSNADSAWTLRHLIPAAARRRWTDRRIDEARYSMGLFVWHFGTNRRYDGVAHHTILLGPRYRELLRDIFDRKRLSADFSLYLHRPTATDRSLAPKGCDAFYALSPVPNLMGGQDWSTEAEPYRRAIARALEASVLPGLTNALTTSHVTTPLDFQTRLNSYRGAGFSLEPILTQSAWFRPHNANEDVRNLFLVGAGTHPGAGLPGVLSSARILDKVAPHASVFA